MIRSIPGRSGWRLLGKILALNALLLFVPLAGALSLEAYERYLLELQERSMVQQARLASAALGGVEILDAEVAEALLMRLGGRVEARLRVVDGKGKVVADTASLVPPQTTGLDGDSVDADVRDRPLYRLGTVAVEIKRALFGPKTIPEPALGSEPGTWRTPEVSEALAGRYGAATRASAGGQRSLTLYSALPIYGQREVVGAVVASQSTVRILSALYQVRLEVFGVFLLSLAVAAAVSAALASSLVRPLERLRQQARDLVDHRGRFKGQFVGLQRGDEIGDLSRALETLTVRLRHHVDFVESFATDVAHELKNPLASVRNASELLGEVEDDQDRQRLLDLIQREVARMGSMISAVREISLIDARMDEEVMQVLDLNQVVAKTVEGAKIRHGREIVTDGTDKAPRWIEAPPERVTQVLENLIDNAVSLTPDDGLVGVRLETVDQAPVMTVWDEGPGIDEEHRARIFDRFFSYRPTAEPDQERHTGLGLSIVRTVVEGLGGSVAANNRQGGGAELVTRWRPALPAK